MSEPTIWMLIRQTLGRAFRETGQKLDRLGIVGEQHVTKPRLIGDSVCIFNDHLSRHRHKFPLLKRGAPIVSRDATYLAPCSTLIGSVRVGPGASIWYGAILRADKCENANHFKNFGDCEVWELNPHREEIHRYDNTDVGGGIFIGENSNVQDNCIITSRIDHAIIGKGVTVGQMAQIHSATVDDYCIIGMGSILRENVTVETESIIAAGAVVEPGTRVASGELWVGQPARKSRNLTSEEREKLHYQASEYVEVASGQMGVMDLGGNLSESLVEYSLLDARISEAVASNGRTKVLDKMKGLIKKRN